LGNTSIYLGNTTTTIGNLTLTNVTISSGTANITSNITYATANAVVFTNASSIGTTSANLTFNGSTLGVVGNITGSTLQLGTNPAGVSIGVLGIPNQKRIYGRNAANNADVSILYVDGGNGITLGPTDTVAITSGGILTTTLDASINGITAGRGAGGGASNTVFGAGALTAVSSGNTNSAFGVDALKNTNTGYANAAFGGNTLTTNTSGYFNTGFGTSALNKNISGYENTATGYQSLFTNTIGVNNNAFGKNALYSNLGGNYNVAAGVGAGYSNNSGEYNTFIGNIAGSFNTTGSFNTYTGHGSGPINAASAGNYNTATGSNALSSLTSGSSNTAIGNQALTATSTASNNTAVGYQAGYNNTGDVNVYVGRIAGYSNTGAGANTFVGQNSGNLFNVASGNSFNSFFGCDSGQSITTGLRNTVIGSYSGNANSLNITTSNNYVVLSDGSGYHRFVHDGAGTAKIFPNVPAQNNTSINSDVNNFYPAPDNTMALGHPSYRWTTVYATTALINTSDINTKQQIRDLSTAEKAVAQSIKGLIKAFKFNDAVAEKGDGARIHIGVIAQEVQSAFIAEGLDPSKYAMFCSDTWYEVDGKASPESISPFTKDTPNAVEVTRLGIRYDQLLAFVISTF
jgi:hypothetical protein